MNERSTSEPSGNEPPRSQTLPLPIIERRRIEAEILKHVLDVLTESHGAEVAKATIGAAVSRSAIQQGERLRAALGREPDFDDFAEALKNWTANDALRLDVKEQSAQRLAFDVTRCRYAEMYREMGLGEIGHLLSCNRDGDFCIGYNRNMELTRSETIMQGAARCDFRYRFRDDAGS